MKHLSLLILLTLLTVGSAKPQSPAPFNDKSIPEFRTDAYDIIPQLQAPQVWSFMKYGGLQPNLYTGTINAQIPIYTYQDPDFEIPISLSYASNGYIPSLQAGPVGLGWFLNAGGCITREVKLFPDEKNTGIAPNLYGFYKYFSSVKQNEVSEDLFSRGGTDYSHYYYYSLNNGNTRTETVPDEFSFNFAGHTGKFSLDAGTINVYDTDTPSSEYRIDMSDFMTGKTITITTGDGYKYVFSPLDSWIYQMSMDNLNNIEPVYLSCDTRAPITTWQLARIIAPNNREAVFTYTDKYFVETISPLAQELYSGYNLSVKPGGMQYEYNYSSFQTNRVYVGCKRQIKMIKSITVGSQTIDFGYVNRKYPERFHVNPVRWTKLENTPQLDYIEVKSGGTTQPPIKRCSLTYGFFGERTLASGSDPAEKINMILYLKQVSISDEGKYNLEYYDQSEKFPFHGTTLLDHWGYYKGEIGTYTGEGDLTTFIPKIRLDDNYKEYFNNNYRDPKFAYAKMGMLKQMTYPTGGFTKYYYENHDYNALVTRDYTSGNKPYLTETFKTLEAGGVRIKRITDFSTPTDSIGRSYTYSNSGVMLHFPRYKTMVDRNVTSGNGVYQKQIYMINSSTDLFAYNPDGTHIEYGDVREDYDDGRYNWYKFTTYREMPDKFEMTTQRPPISESMVVIFPDYPTAFYTQPISMAAQRGRLTFKESGANKSRQFIEEYVYDQSKPLKYYGYVELSIDANYIRRICTEKYPLTKVVKTDFTYPDRWIFSQETATETLLRYNPRKQLCASTTTNSDGTIRTDSIYFVTDIAPSKRTAAENELIARNMVNKPIGNFALRGTGASAKVVKAVKYEYQLFGGKPYIHTIQSAAMTVPQSLSSVLEYMTDITCSKYDSKGRILETVDRAGVPTTYIWGYGGLYPIGVLVNASLDQVKLMIGASIETTPLADYFSVKDERALRSIPGVHASFYKYDPGMGIVRISGPDSRHERYTYKAPGKLSSVIDEDGNMLKAFFYGFATDGTK